MKILELLNDYYGSESKTLEEFFKDIKESDDLTLPAHIRYFLKYVERKENE